MGKMDNVSDILPLSPVQEGMLFETAAGAAPPGTYVAAMTITFNGPLDPETFKSAAQMAISERDALRAAFIFEGVRQPVQLIHEKIELPFEILDWSQNTAFEADLARLITQERTKGFDLKKAPLMRGILIKRTQTRHYFIWIAHHLVSDGWSTGILINDILAFYHGADLTSPQSKGASFKHYLAWLKSRDNTTDTAFWTDYLAGVKNATTIAYRPPNGPCSDQMHRIISRDLPDDLMKDLKATARVQRVTSATLLSTVWALVLRRYSCENDVVFGQTNSGRPTAIKGIETAVGAFINTLPVRLEIDANETASALLARAEADAIKRRSHEQASLRDVLECSEVSRGRQIFETLFVFEDFPQHNSPKSDISLGSIARFNSTPHPLTLLIFPETPWRMDMIFDPALLDEAVVAQMIDDYQSLLTNLVDATDTPINELADLSWGAPVPAPSAPPAFRSILDDISHWATTTPNAKALNDQNTTTSYAALDAASNAIAATLQSKGIGKGDIVPIALERSADVVTAMLGILKTGACYTPLDLSYPSERLAQTIKACTPKLIVTSTGAASKLPESTTERLPIDALSTPQEFHPVDIQPDDLAYIIFTSGSSGTPKGVKISHGNLAYSTQTRDTTYPAPPTAFLLLSSFAFDSSVVGIYWTLTKGGKLVVSPPKAEQDIKALAETIRDESISHLLCLPSLYDALLKAAPKSHLASLTTTIVAGEALLPATLTTHQAILPNTALFNEYGPTETTVWCAAADLSETSEITIGTPPKGTSLTISDPDGNPLPTGMTGEITISGPGVAKGYLHTPEATAKAFPNNTYKTGDLGYKRVDGHTIFMGRKDAQIKIRGHRIELEDVQTNIAKILNTPDLAVLARPSESSHQLACILSADPENFDAKTTKAAIAAKLPAHMVPTRLIAIKTLPRLPNGKIDTTALNRLIDTQEATNPEQPQAATYTETQLTALWSDILATQNISPKSDFFDLGGDSLKTVALSLKAEEKGLNIAPYELFEYPILRDLAAHLHTRAEALSHTIPDANLAHANDSGEKPIFFMIHGSLKMYSYLSAALGKDRPLGFLFSHFFSGEIHPNDRIESLTDEAMTRLKSLKPNGPYHLGGYSLGGIIALELAHRLREMGETVDTLFLLDPSYDVRTPKGSTPDKAKTTRHCLMENIKGRALMTLANLTRQLPGTDKNRARMTHVGNAYRRILTYYRPPVYEGQTVIMTTPAKDGTKASTHWQHLALPNASRQDLPFDHFDLQRDPDALMAWTSKLCAILNSSETL